MNIFWVMKILWIFLGGHHKIGLYLGVISMHLKVFSIVCPIMYAGVSCADPETSVGGGGGEVFLIFLN